MFSRWKSDAQSGACGACANCGGGVANCGGGVANCGGKCWKSGCGGPERPCWKASNSESNAVLDAGDDRKP
jgi:hypothetical protein